MMAFQPDTQQTLDAAAAARREAHLGVLERLAALDGVGGALEMIALGFDEEVWLAWAEPTTLLGTLLEAQRDGYALLARPRTGRRARPAAVVQGTLLRALATVEDLVEFLEETGGAR
jgi:hypothetical protein